VKVIARVLSAAALVAALGTAAPAHAAAPSFECDYKVLGSWNGGFWADLTIANNGPAISGWYARWSMTHETSGLVGWNAIMTMPTAYEMTATSMPWNAQLRPGGATTFGWTARAAATEVPTDITVNGVLC
jgi:hypothetical protein